MILFVRLCTCYRSSNENLSYRQNFCNGFLIVFVKTLLKENVFTSGSTFSL
ncbi:MAG: hypothetical protein IJS29_04735 [Selenomonadaceae bacterium]|nr:hypothetical protein [Selenomonadaceae bacterium]